MRVNRIINKDCRQGLRRIKTESVDLVVTSPPYDDLRDYSDGNSDWNFKVFRQVARGLVRVLKPGGVIVWVVGDQVVDGAKTLNSYRQALYFTELGLNMYDVIIYEKAGSGPPHHNRYFNTYEYMFVLSKGKPKTVNLLRDKPNKYGGLTTYGNVTRREKDGTLTDKGRKTINDFGIRTNIWRYANGKGFATRDDIAYRHPAIFPEKLALDHILSWSNEGDLVLDPFAGSGTTAKMSIVSGRRWIAIEKSTEYCAIIKERLQSCVQYNLSF